MSGVKGLSGRKSLKDEEKRQRVIERSWDIIELFFSDENIPLKVKAELASKLTVKDLPTQLEGNLTFTQMKEITVGNRIQEFIVGDNPVT